MRTIDASMANETCRCCGTPLKIGDQAVVCPRCKGVHHLACWTDKGGCSTHGCFQLADAALIANKERTYDPPAKESLAWLPAALTVLLIILVAVGVIWARYKSSVSANTLTVMVPTSPDFATIERVAHQFDASHDDVRVSAISIPLYYEEKLVVMLAAKDAPGIILLPYARLAEYVKQGVLTPLDELKTPALKTVAYGKRINNGVVDGHLYGLPHPSQPGLFAVPASAHQVAAAKEMLLLLLKELPFKPGIDDKQAAEYFP